MKVELGGAAPDPAEGQATGGAGRVQGAQVDGLEAGDAAAAARPDLIVERGDRGRRRVLSKLSVLEPSEVQDRLSRRNSYMLI